MLQLCISGRSRRVKAAIGLLVTVVVAAGCASLPDARLYLDGHNAAPVEVEGARGLLSAQQSAAILDQLKRKSGDIDSLEKHAAIEQAIVGSALTAGNKVVLLQDGPATYKAMFAAIGKARNHINLETYIIEDDETGRQFADLLLKKQAQGVQVNLIYDSVGSIHTPKPFFDRLREGGIKVLEFNPVNPLTAKKGWQINNRDHRKLLVVDGQTAFVGGINISSVYSTGSSPSRSTPSSAESIGWRDTHLQIEGPVVDEFQKFFMATWTAQHGAPLTAKNYFPALTVKGHDLVRAIGSKPEDPRSLIYLTLVSAIAHAEKQVHLTNAYFVPDPQFLKTLIDAAQRGVDVKLILPSVSDSGLVFHAGRSHYSELLAAGVKIYERGGSVLHSKTVCIDGVWSSIGSTNLDWRSFLHNDELNAVVLGREFAQQMQAMFAQDLAASTAITAEEWEHRPLRFKFRERAARLWEYWL
ncbi:MAG TPA: cardiolipin synthase [Burkholderiales bacterium]|nr:cardiolipin synthase [Burkholderiales bacterium]